MATKLYLPYQGPAPAISPTINSNWDKGAIAEFFRSKCSTTKGNTTLTSVSKSITTTGQWCVYQYVTSALNGNQTISGNFSFQIWAQSVVSNTRGRADITIRVIAPDGVTVRGTLKSAAVTGYIVTTGKSVFIYNSAFITPVNALSGDFIVIEIGLYFPSQPETVTLVAGESGSSDYAHNNSSDVVPGKNPSIQFSQDLVFVADTPPGAFTISSAVAGNGKATLTWGASEGAVSYTVKYGTESGVYTETFSTNATSPTEVTGLINGTPYFFMVVAVNAGGETNATAEATATPINLLPAIGILDLNAIKEQLQTIFEDANTTTASSDLSSGLETRVQKILKVHPGRIPIQSSYYPFVTIYIERKEVEEKTKCNTRAYGKRRADVDIKIAGCVWNSSVTNDDGDDASDDAESLMENIEDILRNYSSINKTVSWSFPTRVTYHNYAFEEDASLSAGVMTYKAVVYY